MRPSVWSRRGHGVVLGRIAKGSVDGSGFAAKLGDRTISSGIKGEEPP
jgi:hypothetical protein